MKMPLAKERCGAQEEESVQKATRPRAERGAGGEKYKKATQR